MNSKPYIVFLDNYGRRCNERSFATFEEAVALYTELKNAKPRRHTVELHNTENYDYDCGDGLTADERDEVWSI